MPTRALNRHVGHCERPRDGTTCGGMATRGDMVAAITAYMASRKRIVGYDSAPTWGPGFSPHEVVMKYPLEVDGELRGQLWVIGFPRAKELKFRLEILMPVPICRLDYTDETHPNSAEGYLMGSVPPVVVGPHYQELVPVV
jgi:hypothetical protein